MTSISKDEKKLLLESYNLKVKSLCSISLRQQIDHNNEYLLYYLSENIHYEFWFINNGLQIALHFEKEKARRNELIQLCWNIIKISKIPYPFILLKERYVLGCAYIINNPREIDKVSNIMSYLIDISWPLLITNKLVDKCILEST